MRPLMIMKSAIDEQFMQGLRHIIPGLFAIKEKVHRFEGWTWGEQIYLKKMPKK